MIVRDMSVQALQPKRVIATIESLRNRIEVRLPGRNLVGIAEDVQQIARQAAERSNAFSQPNVKLRVAIGILVVTLVIALIYIVYHLRFTSADAWDVISGIEAGISCLVFMGVTMIFLITLEGRVKRKRALDAIHELRVLAHIIDMHQLSKDPERLLTRYEITDVSPKPDLSPFLLSRYLDYCSELLSLIGKIAVIYAQDYQDAVVLNAVNEIEVLTTGLSRKIWQKIMILEQDESDRPKVQS